ncbi:GspE/PulE family protein [Neorhizobium petrolearium]|uniref:GspE/PulE family protein n=1 Tax=Neorhizobium petrolearium TaxID=515361 RepID=UPI003F7CE8A5
MTLHSASPQEFLVFLESSGRITAEAAQRARSAERQTGQPIDIIIRELGILPEAAIATEMADFLQISALTRLPQIESHEFVERLGLDFAADKALVPRAVENGDLLLTVADPFDLDTIRAVRYFFELPLRLEIAPRSAIDDYIRGVRQSSDRMEVADNPDAVADVDLERLQDIARDAPVVKFVSRIIQKAVDEKATDIHIEPEADFMRVRFRRDGMLTSVENTARTLHPGVISRLKILARLNIAERRLPQDGRLRLAVRGLEVDFRLSVVPTIHGETVVLRILDRETVRLELGALGYDAASAEKIRQIIRRPNGMVLVTGPTGSGKTTTLYSILAELNRPEVKIFTVEDPVEYRLTGITQLQIDPAIGLTFASALRSVLRQDPDIILVGEIRDRETAEIAVQAALTGHLVLSTLHTNSAVGAFSRLRDMGVEPFLIDATMRGVIGQRLVRRCCEACRDRSDKTGCPACSGTGFKGRQTTFEILEMSDQIRRAVVSGANLEAIETIARQEGMMPMRDHAYRLAADGITTLAEAVRVVELEDR